MGWGTQKACTFKLEVDIAAAAAGPTLEAHTSIDRISAPIGAIKKVRQYNYGPTSTGDFPIQVLPKNTTYHALHLFEMAAGDVNKIKVEVDQNRVWEAESFLMNAFYGFQGITRQSGVYSIVFDASTRLGDVLPLVNNGRPVSDFLLTVDMAVANNFTLVTEELGLPF